MLLSKYFNDIIYLSCFTDIIDIGQYFHTKIEAEKMFNQKHIFRFGNALAQKKAKRIPCTVVLYDHGC